MKYPMILVIAAMLAGSGCSCSGSKTEGDADGDADEPIDTASDPDVPDDPDAGEDAEADLPDEPDADVDPDPEIDVGPDCTLPEPPPGALLLMGENPDGTRLVQGGRQILPAAPETVLEGFPADVEVHPDGHVAYVTSTSHDDRLLITWDIDTGSVLQEIEREDAFWGLAVHPDGSRVYASGGVADKVEYYDVEPDGTLSLVGEVTVEGMPAGLALDDDGSRLWVGRHDGGIIGDGIVEIDTETMTADRTIPLLTAVYDVEKVPGKDLLYASNFVSDEIVVVNLDLGISLTSVTVGSNPAGLFAHPDGSVVWAAVSGGDEVVAIGTVAHDVIDREWVGDVYLPFATEPLKNSSPNAVWFDWPMDRLYVTRGADNAVLVLDATTLTPIGSIPTGQYPTDLALTPDGATMVVTTGKGGGQGGNPDLGIKAYMKGTVMAVDVTTADLTTLTAQAQDAWARPEVVFPFDFPAECDPPFPIPLRAGDTSPIEHVILVVKENKTWDCVFGDVAGAESDPDLLEFGEDITPNQHALAEQFTNHDNFYTESECSVQGHLWLTGVFVNEYMERIWIEHYRSDVFTAVSPFPEAQPDVGNFFQHLIRHGVDFTNYGEIVGAMSSEGGETVMSHTDLSYPGVFYNMAVKDEAKANHVADQLIGGDFPPFVYVLMPNDHTHGTSAGELTPEAMVNDNDVATGVLVERISHSVYWPTTVLFILEDDPQGCHDHVDPHRSFLLVVSPWARRGHISHVNASFVSVFRTIELILGIPPIARPDAVATPLYDAFTNQIDLTPYDAIPRTVPDETNPGFLPGAELSGAMDFRGPDRNPDLVHVLFAYRKWKMGEMTYEEAVEYVENADADPELMAEAIEESDEHDEAVERWLEYLAEHPEVEAQLEQAFPPPSYYSAP